jgi:hypothetical protein
MRELQWIECHPPKNYERDFIQFHEDAFRNMYWDPHEEVMYKQVNIRGTIYWSSTNPYLNFKK